MGVCVAREHLSLQLWDSSGHERFSHIIRPYYKSCNGLLVCFDVADRQ
jgi:GTPase SAR1 family protein